MDGSGGPNRPPPSHGAGASGTLTPPAAPPPPADSAEVFRHAWRLYEKFIVHNWMRHREVYDVVRRVASRHRTSLSLADFGCGDGRSTLRAVAGLPLTRYIAVDRLRPLLEKIPARLPPGIEVELIEGDLAAVVADPPRQTVDLLLSAYSLHHLPSEAKGEFLRGARRWVGPEGRLVMVDVLRRTDENRRRYLDRFYRHAARRFRSFTPEEQERVREHMEACDYPESLETMQRLCTAAGWVSPRLAYRDREEFFAVLTSRPCLDEVGRSR